MVRQCGLDGGQMDPALVVAHGAPGRLLVNGLDQFARPGAEGVRRRLDHFITADAAVLQKLSSARGDLVTVAEGGG